MPRTIVTISPASRTAVFPNGTAVVSAPGYGTATQFSSAALGLRSIQSPAEIDTHPAFEQALAETEIYEQETIHIETLPAAPLRSGDAEDRIVVRPAIPTGDKNPRVILYEDESGGLSWHFPQGALLTAKQRAAQGRRGLLRKPGLMEFVIPARSAEATQSLVSGPPRGAARGIITKIGRKVLKILIIPVAGKVLEKPVQAIAGAIEAKLRANRVWRLTPETFCKGTSAEFTDWKCLDRKRTLLVVHGIFSSVEGMLSLLPASALARWSEHYDGRVIGFNHLSVTVSPEDNAKFFLELAKQALPNGKFEFDILCHSRGGIVSRTMAERGQALLPETNCDFRKIYFVASPNAGSSLGDAEHIVDMLDVFTNILTQFPDNHLLYTLESVLAVIKLLAYTSEEYLPGIVSMGTLGYIPEILNKADVRSPARYAAAASEYFPRAGVDNGFFTGPFATHIMDQVFKKDGHEVANDLIVPREGVYTGNGHPSFPIANPLVYSRDSGVWHSGFFAQARTVADIEDKLLERGGSVRVNGGADLVAGGNVGQSHETADGGKTRGAFRGSEIRFGGTETAAQSRRELTVERKPEIDFREMVTEGETSDLIVRLKELANKDESADNFSLSFAAEEDKIPVSVELSAPGFIVLNSRTATMTLLRERNPQTEEVNFRLVAKSPGTGPVSRKIIASFFRDGECLGAVTHYTTVAPANYPAYVNGDGRSSFDSLKIGSVRREDVDLIIFVREDSSRKDTFEVSAKCNIPGEEYGLRDMGMLKLEGTEFADFFSKTIDPEFQKFPTDPNLTDEQFEAALSSWSQRFMGRLTDLGRSLWTYLPREFKAEYLRLMGLNMPPRSIYILSDEMVLPWELVRPSGEVNGAFQELPPLGVAHILGRWKPELGARPQPQALGVRKMVLLTPQYDANPLYWAQKESEELLRLIYGIEQPTPVDRKAMDSLLDGSEVQLVHFTGHGEWSATADLTELRLANNESIQVMGFAGRKLGKMAHPFLYLNACTVGRTNARIGRPSGFASTCLDEGWSGMIAPYWPVYDPDAMQFCIKLYSRLKAGVSIGEALQQIRRDNPSDFTAQSYAYFGDPNARLLFPLNVL